MVAALGLLIVMGCLTACGGTSPEPESAADEGPAEVVEAPPPSDSDDEMDGASETARDNSAPATQEDFQAALQLVLQDEALQNSMNLTEPGRFPVKIAGSNIPSGIELVARTEAIQVVPAPEDPKSEPVLVFVSIDLNATSGTFKYRYDVAGIRGTSQVKKTDGRWELTSSRVSEYLTK